MPELDENAIRARLHQRLVETGEKEQLKEFLRQQLIHRGWREQVRSQCQDAIRQRSMNNRPVTVDELVQEMLPKARSQVPADIQESLLTRLESFMQTHAQSLGLNTPE